MNDAPKLIIYTPMPVELELVSEPSSPVGRLRNASAIPRKYYEQYVVKRGRYVDVKA